MKRVIAYFRTLIGMFQHLIAILIVCLLLISLVPGYYSMISKWFLILIVFQMLISAINLRIVNLFLETVILILAIFGLIPFAGWLARFICLPFALLDLASFNKGIIYQKVDIFTKRSVKDRYSGFQERRREKKREKGSEKKKDDIIDVEFKEK